MKMTSILSASIVALSLLAVSAPAAHAAVIENSDGTTDDTTKVFKGQNQTDTNVTIIDNVDPTDPDVDPLDPTDPDQKMLTLDSVPSEYNFESKLQGTAYTIDSGKILAGKDGKNDIAVYNDRIARAWSVKAQVADNQLTRASDSKGFAVTKFNVNDSELLTTGAKQIVFTAVTDPADRTAANNTGTLTKEVSKVAIGFNDANKDLKVNDKLSGKILYTLYNTIDAQ
ncbi:hypothetical protein FC84_GL000536 [Lapidilactobacillus dextrinicus DSM 20335]|uniref:WxL domain-containing protein n=1 Tax=Lapidilactobacillus dextrinicus DSM 20335 TaxID=1423738 RepID=A0A0R2BJZ6_9LACO|nr:hypothetical protein [Lapidilactobacillus dextrinicus]KRM79839.1 hypothetical protein FC84_GL000536 [Lapidilactobacillus dextrinicus DSM 20335]QFG46376.1 hypothetical protein LH506_02385 [Lapidilactobacillus dextrinicus]